MQEIASWDREFQVWQYSVSHSVLLLRSVDSDRHPTRVDVLFPAVEVMKLQPTYSSLLIEKASLDEQAEFLERQSMQISHGALFIINEGRGFAWAADCHWHEDDGDYRSPSRFGPLRGTA